MSEMTRTIEPRGDRRAMMQYLKLPAVAVAFAALGTGAVTTYRMTAPEPRSVTCRSGATALARLALRFGMG